MKINLINSTFIGITFLLIGGCASMTQAPSLGYHEHSSDARVLHEAESGKGIIGWYRLPSGGGWVGRASKTSAAASL
jgi:hypothetical protein